MLSLGTYPTISLTDARQKRDEAKKLVVTGINPGEVRKREKRDRHAEIGNTFETIAREWYEKRVDRWSASYADEMIKTFEIDVFPYIGSRPISEIKPMELMGGSRCWMSEGGLQRSCAKFASAAAKYDVMRLLPEGLNITLHLIW